MASCSRRLTSSAVASDGPTRIRLPLRSSAEASVLPRNFGERRPEIALRLRHLRGVVPPVEAVRAGGAWERSPEGRDWEKEKEKVGACSYAIGDQRVEDLAAASSGEIDRREGRSKAVEVVVAAAITVVLGVGNRVLYKLALVPLKHYPFFLAQLATFGYLKSIFRFSFFFMEFLFIHLFVN